MELTSPTRFLQEDWTTQSIVELIERCFEKETPVFSHESGKRCVVIMITGQYDKLILDHVCSAYKQNGWPNVTHWVEKGLVHFTFYLS